MVLLGVLIQCTAAGCGRLEPSTTLRNGMAGLPQGWCILFRHTTKDIQGVACRICAEKARGREKAWAWEASFIFGKRVED